MLTNLGVTLASISTRGLQTLIWVPFLLTAFTTPSISQEQGPPNAGDLRILVEDWKRLTAPGTILNMNPHVILLFDEGDIRTIEDAKKIGDDRDTCTELIAKNRAAAIPEPTEVRLLGTVQVVCFAFRGLGIPCKDVPATLEGLYREVPSTYREALSTTPILVGHLTEGDWKKHHDGLVKMFTEHDLSGFIGDAYAFVRVVSGTQAGTKGWVRMTELREPKSKP
jgi:hypothetical protein